MLPEATLDLVRFLKIKTDRFRPFPSTSDNINTLSNDQVVKWKISSRYIEMIESHRECVLRCIEPLRIYSEAASSSGGVYCIHSINLFCPMADKDQQRLSRAGSSSQLNVTYFSDRESCYSVNYLV